ncbi:hypothetical protein RBH29_17080 [Herbivorax sp. ANBcel31]|uniref:hypothetical protein n=1 Tax=Herbivorax sp. ANBcel31 TaxID=3069754 RepID=UPI0027B06947|nr:hypothetical protein [Herbivorax sp. ANBcel31]MDQ2088141.1 hypothetical protein [Herbivorax sp. ANBcel31]
MNLGEILTTPIITASLITGIVAFTAAIIQFIIFSIKHNYDKKSNFEQVLKEKLEKIYSPLTLHFNKSFNQDKFINDEAMELILKYGHLLSKELTRDIFDIINIEQNNLNISKHKDEEKEYKNLRNNILEQINKEFEDLQEKYSKNFFEYKMNFLLPWYIKSVTIIKKVCIYITVMFYLILAVILLIVNVTPNPPIIKNPFLNTFLPIWMLIVMLTSLLSLIYVFDVIFSVLKKNKRSYMDFEKVSSTGTYKCRICNKNKVKFIKGDRFQPCNQHSFWQKLKSILKLYSWIIDTENESEQNNIILSGKDIHSS